jgi:hypothetical protein
MKTKPRAFMDTAYSVWLNGQHVGFVVSRKGGWDYQPETDGLTSGPFTYHLPSRQMATEYLLEQVS